MLYQINFEQFNRNEKYQSTILGETIENYVLKILKKEKYPLETKIEIYVNNQKQQQSIQFAQIDSTNSKQIKILLILMKEINFTLQNDHEKKLYSLSINIFETFSKVEKELQKKYFFDQKVQIEKSKQNMNQIIYEVYKQQSNIQFNLTFEIKVNLLFENERKQIELNALQTIRQIKKRIQLQYQNLDYFQMIRQYNCQQLDTKSNLNDSLVYFQVKSDEIIILKQIKTITVRITSFQKNYQVMLNETSQNFIKFICQDNQLVYDQQIKLSHKNKYLKFDRFQNIKELLDADASIELNLLYQKQNTLDIILIQASNICDRQFYNINPKQTVQNRLKLTELDQGILMNGQQVLDSQKTFEIQGINKRTYIYQYQNNEQQQNLNDLSKLSFFNQIRLFGKDIQKFVNYKVKNQVDLIQILFQDFFNSQDVYYLQLNKKSYKFTHLNQKLQNSVFIYKNQFIQLEDQSIPKQLKVNDKILFSKCLEVSIIDQSEKYNFIRKYKFQEQVKTIKKNFIEENAIFKNQSFQLQWNQNDSILEDNDILEKYKNEQLKLELTILLPTQITLKFKFQKDNITRTIQETYQRYLLNLKSIQTALINKYQIDQDCILYFQNKQVNLQQNCFTNELMDNDLLEFKKQEKIEILDQKIEIQIIHSDQIFSLIVYQNQRLSELMKIIQEKIPESDQIVLFYEGQVLNQDNLLMTFKQLKIKDGDEFEVV